MQRRTIRIIVALGVCVVGLAVYGSLFPGPDPNPRGRDAGARAKPILSALRQFAAAHDGRLPESLESLASAHAVNAWPLDPWGRPYLYDSGEGVVVSLGADGIADGYGENFDVRILIGEAPR